MFFLFNLVEKWGIGVEKTIPHNIKEKGAKSCRSFLYQVTQQVAYLEVL